MKRKSDVAEFFASGPKVRVTTMLDEDVLGELKNVAKARGIKYQTLLNRIVRSYVFEPHGAYQTKQQTLTEESVRSIVKDELKKNRKAKV